MEDHDKINYYIELLKLWREAFINRVSMSVNNEENKKWFLDLINKNNSAITEFESSKDPL